MHMQSVPSLKLTDVNKYGAQPLILISKTNGYTIKWDFPDHKQSDSPRTNVYTI